MSVKNNMNSSLLPLLLITISHSAIADEYTALFKDKKYEEIEKVADSQLIINPNYPNALHAKVRLIISEDKEASIEDGIKLGERCVAANPLNSICHETLGNILGMKALKGTFLSAATYAGKIRDSFKTAIDLDPKNIRARSSLMQFYLQAPAIMGGGADKAQKLIIDTIKVMPAIGALLQARLDLQQNNIARAESGALAVNANNDEDALTMQKNLLMSLGYAHIKDKKYQKAQKIYTEVSKRFPSYFGSSYGLGRAYFDQGNFAEAIVQFQKSIAIEATAVTYYHLAKTLQTMDDKPQAIAAYEMAIALAPKLKEKEKVDAQEQIKKLKS